MCCDTGGCCSTELYDGGTGLEQQGVERGQPVVPEDGTGMGHHQGHLPHPKPTPVAEVCSVSSVGEPFFSPPSAPHPIPSPNTHTRHQQQFVWFHGWFTCFLQTCPASESSRRTHDCDKGTVMAVDSACILCPYYFKWEAQMHLCVVSSANGRG